ncbi:MAG: hypothetical protein QOI77_397 [Blastocatellia bacterium]|jgi:hypothetical protein|nr:hypothetical protein [Blastocatellia bacterium]
MFIAPLLTVSLALQRSAMFSGMTAQVEHVSLLWSEEGSFWSHASINISSLRDEEDKSC